MADENCISEPHRVQRKRLKGWRMPENTIYVGRHSGFGNPFMITTTAADAVKDFELWLHYHADGIGVALRARQELRGKNLACWCPLTQPCHADVLLRIANAQS